MRPQLLSLSLLRSGAHPEPPRPEMKPQGGPPAPTKPLSTLGPPHTHSHSCQGEGKQDLKPPVCPTKDAGVGVPLPPALARPPPFLPAPPKPPLKPPANITHLSHRRSEFIPVSAGQPRPLGDPKTSQEAKPGPPKLPPSDPHQRPHSGDSTKRGTLAAPLSPTSPLPASFHPKYLKAANVSPRMMPGPLGQHLGCHTIRRPRTPK